MLGVHTWSQNNDRPGDWVLWVDKNDIPALSTQYVTHTKGKLKCKVSELTAGESCASVSVNKCGLRCGEGSDECRVVGAEQKSENGLFDDGHRWQMRGVDCLGHPMSQRHCWTINSHIWQGQTETNGRLCHLLPPSDIVGMASLLERMNITPNSGPVRRRTGSSQSAGRSSTPYVCIPSFYKLDFPTPAMPEPPSASQRRYWRTMVSWPLRISKFSFCASWWNRSPKAQLQ